MKDVAPEAARAPARAARPEAPRRADGEDFRLEKKFVVEWRRPSDGDDSHLQSIAYRCPTRPVYQPWCTTAASAVDQTRVMASDQA
jgi:hypothetical protein